MATRVFAHITDIERAAGQEQQISAAVSAVILGPLEGQYNIPEVKLLITDIAQAGGNQMRADIVAKVKAQLQAGGLTFAGSDTVDMLPL